MIAAFLTFGAVGLAAFLAAVGWVVKALLELKVAVGGLPDLKASVERIEAQYVKNGGSTMKDALDRIETRQDTASDKLDGHLLEAAAGRAELDMVMRQGHTTTIVNQPAATPI